jgi:hypothetical protein
MVARQTLYHVSHSQPFLLLVIFQVGSHVYLPGPWSSYLHILSSWDDMLALPYSAYLLRWGLTSFFPGVKPKSSVILATQEAEIRRITVQSQPGQNGSNGRYHKKGLVEGSR